MSLRILVLLILIAVGGAILITHLNVHNAGIAKNYTIPTTPVTKHKQKKLNTTSKAPTKLSRHFSIEILDVKESGMLSRVVKAKLINNDGYARNVKVTLELFVDNDRIKMNGKDALVIIVGDMGAKSSVEKEVEISVGFFDGLKIKSKGYVDAKLTISWDGGKEVFKKRIAI